MRKPIEIRKRTDKDFAGGCNAGCGNEATHVLTISPNEHQSTSTWFCSDCLQILALEVHRERRSFTS